jgi:ComF family protein
LPVPVRRANHPAYWLYRWFWSGFDGLYPPSCGGCGRRGARWCPDCEAAARVIRPPVCPNCGHPQATDELCDACRDSPPQYTALRSWALYGGPVRSAVHQLKYKRNVALGEMMGRKLIDCLSLLDWTIDIVTPVPLGIARLAERGYNQASLLARPVALGIGAKFCPQGLSRVRETRSQVNLSAAERRANVIGAFQATTGLVMGRHVLVVDDVTTTGSTLDACAAALWSGGALSVNAITLARTPARPPGF